MPFDLARLFETDLQDPAFALDPHTTASVGDLDHLIRVDLDNGDLDLNGRNRYGWTPLMYAAYYDHGAIVAFLLDRGVPTAGCANSKGCLT